MAILPEDCIFSVQRGDEVRGCLGSELSSKLQVGDLMAVNRAGVTYNWMIETENPFYITEPPKIALNDTTGEFTVHTPAEFEGGVPPFTSVYQWESIAFDEDDIPLLGTGEDRNRSSEPDRPLFAESDGENVCVVFSRATIKTAGHFYYREYDGEWEYINKYSPLNFKGGKMYDGKFYVCGATDSNTSLGGLYVVDPSDNWSVTKKGINDTHAFSVDFNIRTGTVIVAGKSGRVYRTNINQDPELENFVRIDTGLGYTRAIKCDPFKNEWYLCDEPGKVMHSTDDGLTWTLITGLDVRKNNVKILSGYFHLDSENVYFVQGDRLNSCYFSRTTYQKTQTDEWTYSNTSDNKVIIRTGHSEMYYSKSYYSSSDSWDLAFDSVTYFPGKETEPVILSTPLTSGVWLTTCVDEVVTKRIIHGPVEGDSYISPYRSDVFVLLTEKVTDSLGNTDSVSSTSIVDEVDAPSRELILNCKKDAHALYMKNLLLCETDYCRSILEAEYHDRLDMCDLKGYFE